MMTSASSFARSRPIAERAPHHRKSICSGVLSVALSVSAPAFADCGAILMPPEQYDHAPSMLVHLEFRPYFQVDQTCRTALRIRANAREEACTGLSLLRGWLVILPLADEGVTSVTQECLLRHEFGHLNGWLPTHPDARFE